jgi:hypothetical protein
LAHRRAKGDGVGAGMPPLHALEDQIVAGLQGQMQMRHQPWLLGNGSQEVRVRFHLIDGG